MQQHGWIARYCVEWEKWGHSVWVLYMKFKTMQTMVIELRLMVPFGRRVVLTRRGPLWGGFWYAILHLSRGRGSVSVKESESEVAQSCPTLCDPMYYSLVGSSVRGIFQARVLEWVAISFSRGSSQPRDCIRVSHIAGRCFTIWTTREALCECIPKWKFTKSTLKFLWHVNYALI